MPVEKLKDGQYVRIVSVEETLLETENNHDKIKASLGSVHKVETVSDSLQKCILKDLGGIIYIYKDLELASAGDILPKGGVFDVQNLVR